MVPPLAKLLSNNSNRILLPVEDRSKRLEWECNKGVGSPPRLLNSGKWALLSLVVRWWVELEVSEEVCRLSSNLVDLVSNKFSNLADKCGDSNLSNSNHNNNRDLADLEELSNKWQQLNRCNGGDSSNSKWQEPSINSGEANHSSKPKLVLSGAP